MSSRCQQSVEAKRRFYQECDDSVSPEAVRDCFRLGKYGKFAKPRSILVKLNRLAGAYSILSNSGNLVIKCDFVYNFELVNAPTQLILPPSIKGIFLI